MHFSNMFSHQDDSTVSQSLGDQSSGFPQPDFNASQQDPPLVDVSSPAELPVTPIQDAGITRSRTSSISSQTSEASLFGPLPTPHRYHALPSDIESASEVEDSGVAVHTVSKEDLYQYFRKMERRSEKYKAKFVQVR